MEERSQKIFDRITEVSTKHKKVDYIEMRLRAHIKENPEKHKILDEVRRIAAAQFRSFRGQIFHFLKQGIDNYHKENPNE